MIKEPMPHEKMSDDEIKASICNIQSYAIAGQQKHPNLAYFDYIEKLATKLKRHFCPEKFSVMKVSVKELSEMIAEVPVDLPTMDLAYPSPLNNDGDKSRFLSEPRKMTRPDERKD